MNSPTSALSSPLSSLGSRTPSPPPGLLKSSSPAAAKTSDTSFSPRAPSDNTSMASSAPKRKQKQAEKKKSKKSKQTKKAPTSSKKSPVKTTPKPAEVPTPDIDLSTGIPSSYTAAKPHKLQALLEERDSFAEYTTQLLDPNESLVMHERFSKIEEDANKWNRGVRLHEAIKDLKQLAGEVDEMDDKELAEAQERVVALRKEIEDFERKVAERKAGAERDGAKGEDDDSLYGKDAPEGKDIGPGGDSDNSDEKEKYHKATNAMGQGKKRKRGAN